MVGLITKVSRLRRFGFLTLPGLQFRSGPTPHIQSVSGFVSKTGLQSQALKDEATLGFR